MLKRQAIYFSIFQLLYRPPSHARRREPSPVILAHEQRHIAIKNYQLLSPKMPQLDYLVEILPEWLLYYATHSQLHDFTPAAQRQYAPAWPVHRSWLSDGKRAIMPPAYSSPASRFPFIYYRLWYFSIFKAISLHYMGVSRQMTHLLG